VTSPKIARWQKIAQESAKQSGRRKILRVGDMRGLVAFCSEHTKADLKLILWEEEKLRNLRDALPGKTLPQTIALIIGPEGGFTPQEIDQASYHGFLPIGLGPRVLRVETVTLALLTILQYQYGDLG
jgi:16S rRNA (uracil1498-N3)-methyltransferase